MKHFRKRGAILACLRASRQHPSAEAIFDQLKPEYPDLSLGTVYRNLTLFKEQGLITSLGTVGGVERFDGDTSPHVHFVCKACGKVQDLPWSEPPAPVLEAGGRIDSCQVTFTGLCRECL